MESDYGRQSSRNLLWALYMSIHNRIRIALAIWATLALTIGANSQGPSFGFPPGTFQNRAALDTVSGCSPGAEATSFLARTSGLDAAHTGAYCVLIDGLVTDSVYSILDGLYVFATADTTTALLNLP